jgi:hypothetical protein
MSCQFMAFMQIRVNSCHECQFIFMSFMSFHFMSIHFLLCQFMSFNVISWYFMSLMQIQVIHIYSCDSCHSCHSCQFMTCVIVLFRKFSKVGEGGNMSSYAFGDSYAVRPKAKRKRFVASRLDQMRPCRIW